MKVREITPEEQRRGEQIARVILACDAPSNPGEALCVLSDAILSVLFTHFAPEGVTELKSILVRKIQAARRDDCVRTALVISTSNPAARS